MVTANAAQGIIGSRVAATVTGAGGQNSNIVPPEPDGSGQDQRPQSVDVGERIEQYRTPGVIGHEEPPGTGPHLLCS